MSDLNEQVLAELGDLLATHYEDMQAIGEDRPELALGRYLRACRKWQVLTITEVAAIANVPASEVLAYEQGLIPKHRINIDSLQALARALDESIERFVLLLEADLVTEKKSGSDIPWKHRFLSNLSTYLLSVRQIQAHHVWRAVAIVVLLFCFNSTWSMAPAPGQSTGAAVAGYTDSAPLVTPLASHWVSDPMAGEQSVVTTILIDGAEVASESFTFAPALLTANAETSGSSTALVDTPVVTQSFQWSYKAGAQEYLMAVKVQALPAKSSVVRSQAHTPVANQSLDSTTAAAPGSDLAMAVEPPVAPTNVAMNRPLLLEIASPPPKERTGAVPDWSAANRGDPGGTSLSQAIRINQTLAATAIANLGRLASLFTAAPLTLADTLAIPTALENSRAVTDMGKPSPQQEPTAAPQILHTITPRENPWCIAMKYYELGSLYPLICLYNFGNSECGGSLQPGKTLAIPTIENFTIANGQPSAFLEQTRARELEQLKTISTDFMRVNQSKLRGIDYFCEKEDYETYGAPLIATGQVKAANVAGRVP